MLVLRKMELFFGPKKIKDGKHFLNLTGDEMEHEE